MFFEFETWLMKSWSPNPICCAIIAPWNFPLAIFMGQIVAALVCGNTVIAKPAEQTPLSALYIAELALEAGIPEGVLNVVTGLGPNSAGEFLANHMDVDKIAFTGEDKTGREID